MPHRSSVLLKPTLNCLVHLTDAPFFVLTLDEVEVAFFERVQFGLRNFDLVFVFADYTKATVRIDVIPITSLDPIKKWLTEVGIMWFEGTKNFNWKNIMNTIVLSDTHSFWEGGGWKQFAVVSDDEEEGELDESSDEDDFVPVSSSDDDDASDDSDDSDDDDYSAEESSDEDYSEEDSEGEDWDELEHKARRDDMMKKPDWDGDDDKRKPAARRQPATRAAPAKAPPAKARPVASAARPGASSARPGVTAARPVARPGATIAKRPTRP